MHINTHLDFDVVALEADDSVAVMIELEAPAATTSGKRPEQAAIVVLDRSGSMSGPRLTAAKRALLDLVARLDEDDSFGLVAFDSQARVVVPAGRVGRLGRDRIRAGIESVEVGGSTDLSSGYLRGLLEARRVIGKGGATILVLSDGQANSGIVDPAKFREMAAASARQSITTSSIGIGTGYNDQILSEMAIGGTGNHTFAVDADGAAAAVAGELDGLLSKTVQAASVLIKPGSEVAGIRVENDLPAQPLPGGVLVELGDFYAGETRRLLFTIDVPAMAGLGLAQVAEFVFNFVSVPGLEAHTVTVPVSVNVVPQDVAAGRVPDAKVQREKLIQEVQTAKRVVETALRVGDIQSARASLAAAQNLIDSAQGAGDDSDLAGESDFLRETLDSLGTVDPRHSGRSMSASRARRSRGHTNRTQGGESRGGGPGSSGGESRGSKPSKSCPSCGAELRRIVYGMPGPGLIEAAKRGEVVIGGCIPNLYEADLGCPRCGLE